MSGEGKAMHFDTNEAGQAVLSWSLQVQSQRIYILHAKGSGIEGHSIAGGAEPVQNSPWPSDRTGSEIIGPELQGCSRESVFTWRTHLNVHLFSLLWPLPPYFQSGYLQSWDHEQVGEGQAVCPSLCHGITGTADLKPILALAPLNTSVSTSS